MNASSSQQADPPLNPSPSMDVNARLRDKALSQSWLLSVVAPVAVVVIYAICLAVINRDQLQWFHGESGPVEILTALAFLATAVLGVFHACKARGLDPQTPAYIIAAYLFIAATALFMMLEEISYGQHLLGFASPPAFAEYNKQGEMNLHNLFDDKPSSTLRLIANVGLPCFGIALPLIVSRLPWGYRRPNWSWYLLPRAELMLWIVFSMVISPVRKLGGFSEGYDHPWRGTFSEFKELLWAATALVLLLVLIRRMRLKAKASQNTEG